jgi:hypothetical protein
MKKLQTVYLLREEEEGTGEIFVTGVFSTKELAEKAHDEFEMMSTQHWPTFWEITELVVDEQITRLKELFGVEL